MWDTRTKESDSPNHWGWKTPLQVILPNSVQAGSPREGRPGWLLPPRMWSVQAVPVLHCPHSSETFSIHWLLFCHRSPLKIAWLHLLYCLHSDIHALWWGYPPSQAQYSSVHKNDVPAPKSSLWPFSGLSPACLCSGETRTAPSSPDVVSPVLNRGEGSRFLTCMRQYTS